QRREVARLAVAGFVRRSARVDVDEDAGRALELGQVLAKRALRHEAGRPRRLVAVAIELADLRPALARAEREGTQAERVRRADRPAAVRGEDVVGLRLARAPDEVGPVALEEDRDRRSRDLLEPGHPALLRLRLVVPPERHRPAVAGGEEPL